MKRFFGLCVAGFATVSLNTFADDSPYPPLLPLPFEAFSAPVGLRLQHVSLITRHGLRVPTPQLRIDTAEWDCGTHNNLQVSFHDALGANVRDVPLNALYARRTIHLQRPHDLRGTCQPGQLTRMGANQLLRLGQLLRQRYVKEAAFLPETFDATDAGLMYVRSSNYERTIESCQALLTGLYPLNFRRDGDEGMFRINIRKLHDENMYWSEKCGRVRQLFEEHAKTPEYKASFSKLAALVQRIKGEAPTMENGFWFNVVSTVDSLKAHGHPMPQNLTLQDVRDIHEFNKREINTHVATPEMARLSVGMFTAEVFQNLSGARFAYYSAHDHTILPVLRLLNKDVELDHPTFASYLIFEVFADKNLKRYVRVLYNGQDFPISGVERDVATGCYNLEQVEQHLRPSLIFDYAQYEDACRRK